MDTSQKVPAALPVPVIRHRNVTVQHHPFPRPADIGRQAPSMAIPGVRQEFVPPPLPPPRYNHALAQGHDIGWECQNDDLGEQRGKLVSLKPGSSLLGGFQQYNSVKIEHSEGSDMNIESGQHSEKTPSQLNVNGTRAPDSSDACGMHRNPSSSFHSQGFLGDIPLAQQSHHQSTNAYDKHLLLRIGKANSPPRHRHMKANAQLDAQTLAIRTNVDRHHDPQLPAKMYTRSPMSSLSALSTFSFPRHHERNPGMISPMSDRMSVVNDDDIEPGRDLALLRASPSRSHENPRTRSERGSYDSIMTSTEVEDATFGNFEVEERPRPTGVHLGAKKRALLPLHKQTSRDSIPTQGSRRQLSPKYSYTESPVNSETPSSMTSTTSSTPAYFVFSAHAVSPRSSYTSMSSAGASFSRHKTGASTITPREVAHDNDVPAKQVAYQEKDAARLANTISEHTRIGNYFLCSCCPKKPRRFEKEEQLKAHEDEKQYACAYCSNRFKNKNEAERHQNSLHVRRQSWSCAALSSYQAAFHPSFPSHSQNRTSDICGFCGQEFPAHEPDWDARIDHLTNIHKFGECNSNKKFFRADHFRQHLKHSHGGKTGKWTNILESSCQREESSDAASSFPSVSEQTSGASSQRVPAGWPDPS